MIDTPTKPAADICQINLDRRNRNWDVFKWLIQPHCHHPITMYIHPLYGFDIVRFDEDFFMHCAKYRDTEISLHDALLDIAGQKALNAIMDLIGETQIE